uniref:Uncharacterized protein n=1 Tax=Rhodnius prolixus TaxID=13249 RepID=T1HY06_RHOPR
MARFLASCVPTHCILVSAVPDLLLQFTTATVVATSKYGEREKK